MKVLSAMFSLVLIGQLSFMPLAASAATTSTTSTTTTTQQQSVAPVQSQTYDSSSCQPQTLCAPAVIQQSCAPAVIEQQCAQPCPTVITQPAVVECPRRNMWAWLAVPIVLGGIATAIAVPIAVHHHHHNFRNQVALEQQQLLLFDRATP
jgi:sensor c-di-GMP phosphodiesterase-like protein